MNVIAYNVYDKNKIYLGEISSIISAQWLEIYDDVGELKLVCGISSNNIVLLKKGYYLQNTERTQVLAIIKRVITDDDAKAAKITVRAPMTAVMWEDRVLMYTETFKNSETDVLRVAEKNCRGLQCSIGTDKNIGKTIDKQISWNSILKAIISVTQTSDLGFKNSIDTETLAETFELYTGIDRTDSSNEYYVGYIGRDSGTLGSFKLVIGEDNFKNIAIVAGEGEGPSRFVVEVDLSNGDEKKEIFVDARNISKKYTLTDANGNRTEITYTDEEYRKLLYAKGIAELSKKGLTLDVSASLQQNQMLVGTDYDLGDILPIFLPDFGLCIKARIQSLLFITEVNKNSVTATLKNMEVLKI